jgi:hypothetical protein
MKKIELHLHTAKIEYLLPVFFGGLVSLALCAHMAAGEPVILKFEPLNSITLIREPKNRENDFSEDSALEEEIPFEEENVALFFAAPSAQRRDLIRELYREPDAREWVTRFFAQICNSQNIAEIILASADEFDISPALAFALSWEESRFNPMAVNYKNKDESIDRGLFQLNNRSFPRIEVSLFFDPRVNAHYGMGHLRHCLNTGGSEIAALAMYNAGSAKVKDLGTPKSTLDYVNRILENRRKIEARFNARLQREADALAEEKSGVKRIVTTPEQDVDFLVSEFNEDVAAAVVETPQPRLVRLAPLSGR